MKIGTHIIKNKSYSDSIKEKKQLFSNFGLEFKVAQLFVIGPKSTKDTLNDAEKQKLKKITDSGDVELVIHGNYLDHILGKRAGFAKSLILRELKIGEEIGARGVVVHIPSKSPEEIAEVINNFPDDSKLLLEINSYKAAAQFNYAQPKQLKKLFALFKRSIGLVVDTAHLWAGGIDIETYDEMNKWLNQLTPDLFGEVLFHLNDQKWEKGSGNDKHMPLTLGTIWGDYGADGIKKISDSGIAAVADWAAAHDNSLIIFEEHDSLEITPNLIIFKSL